MEIKDIKTTGDLEEAIEERAGLGLRDGSVPVGKSFAWFDNKTFKLFEQVPITKMPLAVFAMFQDPDEVRVYAVISLDPKTPPDAKLAEQIKAMAPYQRFTLSKHNTNVFIDVFPGTPEEPLTGLETFVDIVSNELLRLATDVNEGAAAIDTLERAREALDEGKIEEAMAILKDEGEDETPKDAPNGTAAPSPTA